MASVDWYLDGDAPEAIGELRHEARSYLLRHCEPDSDVDEAEIVFAEVVGNAVRHAGGPIWVSISWRGRQPTLSVRDLGPGFDPERLTAAAQDARDDSSPGDLAGLQGGPDELPESGRGLHIVSHLASQLEAHTRVHAGMHVEVTLPVSRPTVVSPDPPRRRSSALPALSEARPGGGFGRESFLRALVVELAQALEFQHGPEAADAAVAQVGIDVGGQMEKEYRAAHDVVGRMTPAQMADCYVRLKHAIDGGFYVIESNEHRIVLGNRRCPFGDVVQLAPSLCQMTSSVFGGIAAHNTDDGAAVLLEERIAVGDPGCRVVVHLGEPPEGERQHAQRYSAPAPETGP